MEWSGCVPLKGLVDLLSTRASAFTYVNVPSCPAVFCEAHAHMPVHAWSQHW